MAPRPTSRAGGEVAGLPGPRAGYPVARGPAHRRLDETQLRRPRAPPPGGFAGSPAPRLERRGAARCTIAGSPWPGRRPARRTSSGARRPEKRRRAPDQSANHKKRETRGSQTKNGWQSLGHQHRLCDPAEHPVQRGVARWGYELEIVRHDVVRKQLWISEPCHPKHVLPGIILDYVRVKSGCHGAAGEKQREGESSEQPPVLN